ncbi:cadherin-like beta sandwich domain-containing protein [Chloroflexota bacterium]
MKKLVILIIVLALVIPLAVPLHAQVWEWNDGELSGPLLAELTLFPTLGGMDFEPGNNLVQGYYSSPGVTQTEITAVPEDPSSTMTLDGKQIISGAPETVSMLGGWSNLQLVVTSADGQLSNTYVLRIINEDQYERTGVMVDFGDEGGIRTGTWPTQSQITLTVNASLGGPTLYTDTQVAGTSFGTIHIVSEGDLYWDLQAMGWPIILSPGMEVVVTDGIYSASHVILPLTVDEIDLDADLIRGTGQPGILFAFDVFLLEGGEDDELIDFNMEQYPGQNLDTSKYTVDESGNWEFDFAAEGFDLTTDFGIGVVTRVREPHWPRDKGRTQMIIFDLLNPQGQSSGEDLGVSLDMNLIVMDHIIPGVEAILTVLSEPGGEVLFTGTAQADTDGFLIWGGPAGQGSPLGIDLKPGMEVSVDWGNVQQSTVLVDLSVEDIDVSLDTVSGFGSMGEEIRVVIGLWDPSGGLASFQPIAAPTETVEVEADGSWIVDLAAQGIDILEGMAVAALSGNIFAIGYAEIDPVVELENQESILVSDQEATTVSTIASDGASAEVTIPAAALPSDSSVNVAAITNIDDLIDQVPLPEVANLVSGFVLNATAEDGSNIREGFADSISLEFVVDASAIPEGTPPSELVITFWNGAEWVVVETTEAIENPDGSISLMATTKHLSVFGVAHDPKGAVEVGPVDPLDEFTPNSLMALDPVIESLAESDSVTSVSDGLSTTTLVAIVAGAVALLAGITSVAIYRRRRRA